ncbi:phosphatidate cytidylyltransferase [uncultured Hymenobacter sp.]|uniref:phosphatidate cytidylyltransferase n=1 Tax=uncultured Hymenobacter sp. TaxID=170016 RepID=UPI0035C97704
MPFAKIIFLLAPIPTPPPPAKAAPSNLRLRLIYGVIGAVGLLGCVWFGPVTFGLFFAATQAVMLKEFYRIMRACGYKPAAWIGIIASIIVFATIHLTAGNWYYSQLFNWTNNSTIYPQLSESQPAVLLPSGLWLLQAGSTFFLWLIAGALLAVVLVLNEILRWPNNGQPFINIGATLGGIFYVSLSMSLLNILPFTQANGYDYRRVFCLLFLIWASDIGAYAAGKTWGKHKLAPNISPAKTWEGWAGGALLTLIIAWVLGSFIPDLSLTHRLVAAGVVAIFGPLGDLAESMLKRSAGVKDSGTFLPGHGGLLDRFDAFLLVLPVLALLQLLAGQ